MLIVILNCADAICQLSKISPCLLKLQLAHLFETLLSIYLRRGKNFTEYDVESISGKTVQKLFKSVKI